MIVCRNTSLILFSALIIENASLAKNLVRGKKIQLNLNDNRIRTLDSDRPVAQWRVSSSDNKAHLKVIINNISCGSDGSSITSIIDNEYSDYLYSALEDWSKSDMLSIETVNLENNECSSAPIQYEGYINVVHDNLPWHQWIGLTTWEVDADNYVSSALVRFNDHKLFNKDREAYTSNVASRQMAVCHELGHAVGLPHQDENENNINSGSCMDYTTHPEGGDGYGSSDLHPNIVDFEELDVAYAQQLYNHRGLRHLTSTHDAHDIKSLNAYSDKVEEGTTADFGMLLHESERKGMIRRAYEKPNNETGGRTITFTVEHGQ